MLPNLTSNGRPQLDPQGSRQSWHLHFGASIAQKAEEMSVASQRVLDYLEAQPGIIFNKLYQQPSTALAIFRRMLPHLGEMDLCLAIHETKAMN